VSGVMLLAALTLAFVLGLAQRVQNE